MTKLNVFNNKYWIAVYIVSFFLFVVFCYKLRIKNFGCIDYKSVYKIEVYKGSFISHKAIVYNKIKVYKNNEVDFFTRINLGFSGKRKLGEEEILFQNVATPYTLYKKANNDTLVLRKSINQYDSIEYKFLIDRFCDTLIVRNR